MDEKELITKGRKILSQTMRKIRQESTHQKMEPGFFMIPSEGNEMEQALFWVSTRGCSYARSASGGCTMCHFGFSTEEIQGETIVKEFAKLLENKKIKKSPVVNYGGQGSFFDDAEHPSVVRRRILAEIAKRDGIKAFVCESRPEFITKEKIQEVREILGDRTIEIGIGIESTNPLVREGIINKGFSEYAYKNVLSLAKEFDIELSLNVMFKPLVLSEREAIEDSVKTIKRLLKGGPRESPIKMVILMIINIKKDTLVGWAYEKELYQPPLLWSCLEILKRLTDNERRCIKILGFNTGIKPLRYVSNNDETTDLLIEALKFFDFDHKMEPLLRIEEKYKNSSSYRGWEKRMCLKVEPLNKRLEDFYELLIKEFNLNAEKSL